MPHELQFQESTVNGALGCGIQRGMKRLNHHTNPCASNDQSAFKTREGHIIDAFPIAAISSGAARSRLAKRTKVNNLVSTKSAKSSKKAKVGEDLNRHVTSEWDALDLSSVNQIIFDESQMPIPVCSCTGVARQCYNGEMGAGSHLVPPPPYRCIRSHKHKTNGMLEWVAGK